MNSIASSAQFETATRPIKLGFLGVGWIGRHRMEAMLGSGLVEAAVIADASSEMLEAAASLAPSARHASSLDELLAADIDGVVIATPSALHAEQSIRALEAGKAVFCQKPLGRTAKEVRAVVEAARRANRLLGVDLSYRQTEAMRQIKSLLDQGGIGPVFAVDLTFHNAYGPDKPWFYDKALSGGGCVMDLGVHLIDLALWSLGFPKVEHVTSHLLSQGKPLSQVPDQVEDYAVATFELEGGTIVKLACSWRLPAGRDCVIEANFYGSDGGASMRNLNGSFYDLAAERFAGTSSTGLVAPPDDWGGKAAIAWARQLSKSPDFDPESDKLVDVADVIDRIYGTPSVRP